MKLHPSVCLVLLVLISGCSPAEREKDSVAIIDVTKNYPEKTISLQDVADVSYIHLNADNEDYLYNGHALSITKNTIVAYDHVTGAVLFFSKDGTPKARFNHKGNGPGEYTDVAFAVYDEEKDELYVTSFFLNRIEVYSSTGAHKRTLSVPDGTNISRILLFDNHSLLLHDRSKIFNAALRLRNGPGNGGQTKGDGARPPFARISATDGTVLSHINIPEKADIDLFAIYREGEMFNVIPAPLSRLVRYKDGFLLGSPETGTVFYCDKELNTMPLMVQTPSVAGLDPKIVLNTFVEAGPYWFFDVFTLIAEKGKRRPPSVALAMDKNSKEIYKSKIVVDEYQGKEIQITPDMMIRVDEPQTGLIELDLAELKQAGSDNKLSGKLKELVDSLDEEKDNNIYMLLHFK